MQLTLRVTENEQNPVVLLHLYYIYVYDNGTDMRLNTFKFDTKRTSAHPLAFLTLFIFMHFSSRFSFFFYPKLRLYCTKNITSFRLD